jgi:hypothetical protein
MTSETEVEVLAPLPSTLPSVDRTAEIPRGFRAGGIASAASGRLIRLIAAIDGPIPRGIFTEHPPRHLSGAASQPPRGIRRRRAVRASAIVSTSGAANAATGGRRRGPGADRHPRRGALDPLPHVPHPRPGDRYAPAATASRACRVLGRHSPTTGTASAPPRPRCERRTNGKARRSSPAARPDGSAVTVRVRHGWGSG